MTESILTGAPAVEQKPVESVPASTPGTGTEQPAVTDNGTPAVADDKTKSEPPKEAVVEFKPYELKAPDGVELSPEGLKAFNEFANTNKLPEATAKQIAEWYGKHSAEVAKAQVAQWQQVNDGWTKAAKEDKEYGGDKFDSTVVNARAVINKFSNEKEFKDMLNATGAGNHPEMIRFLHRVHEATKEDRMVPGTSTGGETVSLAKRLFPNAN